MSRRLTTISKFCEERAPSLAESNLLMATTIYLSKVLGISLVIIGAVIMIRRRYFVPVFGAFVRERLLPGITANVELLAGVFLVVGHNVWSPPRARSDCRARSAAKETSWRARPVQTATPAK